MLKLVKHQQVVVVDETIAVPTARGSKADLTGIKSDTLTASKQHKANALRLNNFNKAKSSLQRLADLKKTQMNDITPAGIFMTVDPPVQTESVSSVRPTKLHFESVHKTKIPSQTSDLMRPIPTYRFKQHLAEINEQSPFSHLADEIPNKNDEQMNQSFQSEDVMDTIDVQSRPI